MERILVAVTNQLSGLIGRDIHFARGQFESITFRETG
jgi:hypothetical protein